MINVGLYIKKDKIFDNGIASYADSSAIEDFPKNWIINQWKDYLIRIVAGTGQGYYFKCTSNTENNLKFDVLPFELDTTSQYEIYTELSNRVELFNDEKINLTSSIQNANDLGKLFTDYSQSFTVPASKHNNKIFQHWYENSVENGYDHRQRYNAYIELDSIQFRQGKIQLEKANKKNGFVDNYSLTFYGNLTQLKDLFKEDKLNQLDYSDIGFDYVPAGVLALTQSDAVHDLKFPIFGNDKKYKYLSGATDDLTNSNVLDYRDLFPAIRVEKIFEYIQTKYNIVFNGSFLSSVDFTDLYLELKNTEKMVAYVEPSFVTWDLFPDESIEYPLSWVGGTLSTDTISLKIDITPEFNFPYTIYIYRDNVLNKTYNLVGERSGARGITFYPTTTRAVDGVDSVWKVKVQSSQAQLFNIDIVKRKTFSGVLTTTTTYNFPEATGNILDLKRYCPDITINSFMTGIIKQFNLMITPISASEFEFQTLEDYYNSGDILQMTKYFNADDEDINRPILYKKLTFKYEKSENIENNYFRNLFSRGFDYGDLNYENINSNENSNYEISLPFECCMFDRSIDTSGVLTPFITTTFINKDLKPYLPKPFIFYWNGVVSLDTHIRMVRNDAGDYYELDSYNAFSLENLDTNKSLTFNNEISSNDYLIRDGLYENYYAKYVANLYELKTRMTTIKAILPITKITSIRLKDRIVISGKRYLINTMTTDLTSGECTFNLITDYRQL
jgi:hypothetical protein